MHYKANLRDTYFQLFELLKIGEHTLGHGPFATMDEATAREALAGLLAMVQESWAPAFSEGDRVGAVRDATGNVRLPPGFLKALKAYYEGGWHNLELPEALGGYGAPPTIAWAGFEFCAGANAALTFYLLGTQHAKILAALATPSQQQRFVPGLAQQHWGGTMVLTEPGAGSDVGAGTTRAVHVHDDEYHLTGVKRFITNGDYDFPANIVHLVLARPEGAASGTKGLSMFIVPKIWVEADGSLGAPNGVHVSNLEHKMGIKGSATCELTLGADRPCRGLLVGNVHDGIAQMFHVIEYARMGVGTKSMAALSTAYLNALAFAQERVQGADLLQVMDKNAPRVAIMRHPDVRRMLMLQKAFAEGLRGLVFYAAHLQDQIMMAEAAARTGADDAAARVTALAARNDLLLPLIKGYASEKTYELLALSLQCFGGSGYCTDYPIEQYIRDQKIDTLYEGTTAIQGLDLCLRKLARDRGATFAALAREIAQTAQHLPAALLPEAQALGQALTDVQAMLNALLGKMGESLYHVGLQGNRVLFALAELVIGWRLIVGAEVALAAVPNAAGADRDFYEGKLAAARFYVQNVLPGLATARRLVEQSALDVMALSDAAF